MTGRPSRLAQHKSRGHRLAAAAINDNGGRWYLCHSSMTAASLDRALAEPDTSQVLLNSVGGLLGRPDLYRRTGRIWVQILVPDDLQPWQVLAALGDYGVSIVASRMDVPEDDQ